LILCFDGTGDQFVLLRRLCVVILDANRGLVTQV
jgi:hypothetical protein